VRCQYLQHGDTACTCQLLLLLNSNSLRFRPAIETLVSIYQISFNLSRLLIIDSSTLSISHSHLVTSRQAQCILALERFLRSPLGADIFFRFSKIECWWEVGHVSSSGCMIIWWSAAAVCRRRIVHDMVLNLGSWKFVIIVSAARWMDGRCRRYGIIFEF